MGRAYSYPSTSDSVDEMTKEYNGNFTTYFRLFLIFLNCILLVMIMERLGITVDVLAGWDSLVLNEDGQVSTFYFWGEAICDARRV